MPYQQLDDLEICVLSLTEYARLIGYDECAFYGVHYDGQIDYDCSMFWVEWQRMNVYWAIQEAVQLMEEVVGYPLCRTWIGDDQRYNDVQDYRNPILLRYRHFISAGIRAEAVIDALAPISYATEPATVGPMAATITNIAEVKVYYPGTKREIQPSRITYAGGMLTLEIPRCRLVAVPNVTTRAIDYNVLAGFLEEVDVARVYNDPSVAATLVEPHHCSAACSATGCGEYTQTACIYPEDKRLGLVEVIPATYDGGWLTATTSCRNYQTVRFYYVAGIENPTALLKSTVIRLAHARMAEEPCGCSWVQNLWKRDRYVPEVLSRERLNCPFGVSEGAWAAYKVAQSMRITRSHVL